MRMYVFMYIYIFHLNHCIQEIFDTRLCHNFRNGVKKTIRLTTQLDLTLTPPFATRWRTGTWRSWPRNLASPHPSPFSPTPTPSYEFIWRLLHQPLRVKVIVLTHPPGTTWSYFHILRVLSFCSFFFLRSKGLFCSMQSLIVCVFSFVLDLHLHFI